MSSRQYAADEVEFIRQQLAEIEAEKQAARNRADEPRDELEKAISELLAPLGLRIERFPLPEAVRKALRGELGTHIAPREGGG